MVNLFTHLHPMVVHFPIALFVSALILELGSLLFKKENLHQTAVVIYVLATVIAPLVVWTGLEEAERVHLTHHPVLDLHRNFALLTMYSSLLSLPILFLLRKSKALRWIFLIQLLMVVSFVTLTAYNGGRMVYEYGVGIDAQ